MITRTRLNVKLCIHNRSNSWWKLSLGVKTQRPWPILQYQTTKSLSVQPTEKTKFLNGNPLSSKQGPCTHSLGVFVWRAICWQNMPTQHRGDEYEFCMRPHTACVRCHYYQHNENKCTSLQDDQSPKQITVLHVRARPDDNPHTKFHISSRDKKKRIRRQRHGGRLALHQVCSNCQTTAPHRMCQNSCPSGKHE